MARRQRINLSNLNAKTVGGYSVGNGYSSIPIFRKFPIGTELGVQDGNVQSYLQALLKWVKTNYPTGGVFLMGHMQPSTQGFGFIWVYGSESGTAVYPSYSRGVFFNLGTTENYSFGTYGGTWRYNEITTK